MATKKYKIYDPGALDIYKKPTVSKAVQKKETRIVPAPKPTRQVQPKGEIHSKALDDVRKKFKGMSDEKLKLESKLLTYNKIVNKMKFQDLVNVIKIIIKD